MFVACESVGVDVEAGETVSATDGGVGGGSGGGMSNLTSSKS